MNEQELIAQKQLEWDGLAAKRREIGRKIERGYESDIRQELMEYWQEIYDGIEDDMRELEDWLIEHCAPGWVST